MKLTRLPRLSLSFPLLLLGLVALPLLLEEQSNPAAGDLSAVSSSTAEEVPGESGDRGGDEQQDGDTGTPLRPHSAGSIAGEALQAGALQAELVATQFRADDSGGSLCRGNDALYPLKLNTGFSACLPGDPSSCIPAGADLVSHPVRGPPAI